MQSRTALMTCGRTVSRSVKKPQVAGLPSSMAGNMMSTSEEACELSPAPSARF